jgi:UPF0716 family protein affecting phage T7 exclusion
LQGHAAVHQVSGQRVLESLQIVVAEFGLISPGIEHCLLGQLFVGA